MDRKKKSPFPSKAIKAAYNYNTSSQTKAEIMNADDWNTQARNESAYLDERPRYRSALQARAVGLRKQDIISDDGLNNIIEAEDIARELRGIANRTTRDMGQLLNLMNRFPGRIDTRIMQDLTNEMKSAIASFIGR